MDNIQTAHLDENLNEPLELYHSSCFFCNGYYGSSLCEPVCQICHDFIYSDDLGPFRVHNSLGSENDDDGDSGNDEPSAAEEGPQQIPSIPPVVENENELEEPLVLEVVEDNINEEDIQQINGIEWPPQAPTPPPQSDRMANRLLLLSTPWPPHEAANSSLNDMSYKIPPEIWAIIFKKLNDISLIMASKVCRRWRQIINDLNPNSKWEEYIKFRWPLFNPIYEVTDWYSVYSDLIDSLSCKHCFMSFSADLPNIDNNSRSLRSVRLHKELKWMNSDHPEGIEAIPLDRIYYNWLAKIHGPPQSPYQGGIFYINLKIPHDYPLKPPKVIFLTRIFHPNVSRHGDIGIDTLDTHWTLALNISQILLSVQSLLTDPYLETNMEKDVAQLYINDRPLFDKIARIWTWKHGMHDTLVH